MTRCFCCSPVLLLTHASPRPSLPTSARVAAPGPLSSADAAAGHGTPIHPGQAPDRLPLPATPRRAHGTAAKAHRSARLCCRSAAACNDLPGVPRLPRGAPGGGIATLLAHGTGAHRGLPRAWPNGARDDATWALPEPQRAPGRRHGARHGPVRPRCGSWHRRTPHGARAGPGRWRHQRPPHQRQQHRQRASL